MISARELRRAFDGATALTVGMEDEVMLLDPESLELLPRGSEALELLAGDPRYKLELPAAHLEIVTPVASSVVQAAQSLHQARADLAARLSPLGALASAGVHPFSSGRGELNRLERYAHTITEYGPMARRQLVCAFQVHVAVGDADVALAVYNAARCYLPLIAALAANAPIYEGQDSGLASVRPMLCRLLPRQGTPPPIESWERYAQDLQWGQTADSFDPSAWWWELRPHHRFGTLEFRVPDGQSSVADARAIAAVVQSLVAWLGERHRGSQPLPDAPAWRIDENRWSACRHGVEGEMADLASGRRRPTREALSELLDELAPFAQQLQAADELAAAGRLVERNGALAQREIAGQRGVRGLTGWLVERFLDPPSG